MATTLTKESGLGPVGGTFTYWRRPATKKTSASAMSTPGTPKATAGPWALSSQGMSSDAVALPRFTIQ